MVQRGFQFYRIHDLQPMHIENDIAVVGDKIFAQPRLSAQCNQLARYGAACHRNDFDGQWEFTQHIHQFAGVAHTDEFPACRRDNFLARQRAATALDHMHVAGDLVRAVHVHRQAARIVE